MAGEEMAALASLQKQVGDLKSAIYYLTEKLGSGALGAGGGEAAGGDVVAALEALSKEVKALGDQAKALSDQVGYVSRISSDGFSSIKGVTDKVGAIATPQQVDAVGSSIGAKVDALAKSIPPAQDISSLSKKLDAVSENVGFVARQSSDVAKKMDDSSTKLASSSTNFDAKLNTILQRLDKLGGEAQVRQMELLAEALALMNKDLNATRTSYSELSRKFESIPTAQQIDRIAEVQSAQDRRLASVIDALSAATKRISEAGSGAAPDAKQAELLSETLSLMSKELGASKASYSDLMRKFESMPSAQQVDKLVAAMARMGDAQAAQDKKMATILEGLSLAAKQLGEDKSAKAVLPLVEQLNRMSNQLAKVAETAETQRRQNEIMASALSTLVKEVGNLQKGMPSYADIEKRVMGKLAEKMGGGQ
jgi:hypothetical protein